MLTSDRVGTVVGSNSSQFFGSMGIQTQPGTRRNRFLQQYSYINIQGFIWQTQLPTVMYSN